MTDPLCYSAPAIGPNDGGGTPNPLLDKETERFGLTDQEKQNLEEFLSASSGIGWHLATTPARLL
jgi:hypothetical protein